MQFARATGRYHGCAQILAFYRPSPLPNTAQQAHIKYAIQYAKGRRGSVDQNEPLLNLILHLSLNLVRSLYSLVREVVRAEDCAL